MENTIAPQSALPFPHSISQKLVDDNPAGYFCAMEGVQTNEIGDTLSGSSFIPFRQAGAQFPKPQRRHSVASMDPMTATGLLGLRRKSVCRLESCPLIDVKDPGGDLGRLQSQASSTSSNSTDASPAEMKQQLAIATKIASTLRMKVDALLEESKNLQDQKEEQAMEIISIQKDLRALEERKEALEESTEALEIKLRAETAQANDFRKRSFLAKEQLATERGIREKETATREDLIARGQRDLARAEDRIDLLEAEVARKRQRELELQQEVIAAAGPRPQMSSTETQTAVLLNAEDQNEAKQLSTCIKWITLSAQVTNGTRKPKSEACGTQTDPISFALLPSEQSEIGTMTEENYKDNGNAFGRYWDFILAQARSEQRFLHVKGTYMSLFEILHFMSALFTEKAVEDELDDRAQQPRKTLPEFLHTYLISKHGSKQLADEKLAHLLANILGCCEHAHSPISSTEKPLSRSQLRLEASGLHLRAITFARFLGLRVCGLAPISLHGLNAYLDALLRVQGGKLQLLDPSTVTVVDRDSLCKAFDLTLARYREPLGAKTGLMIIESLGSDPSVELDAALARLADAVEGAAKQRVSRLVDLYTNLVQQYGGLLSLDAFHTILAKREGDACLPGGVRQELQLYSTLALWPTLDAQLFVQATESAVLASLEYGDGKKRKGRALQAIPASDKLLWTLEESFCSSSGSVDLALSKEAGSFQTQLLCAKWDLLKDMLQQQYKPELSMVILNAVAKECSVDVAHREGKVNSTKVKCPTVSSPPPVLSPGHAGAREPRRKLNKLPRPLTRGGSSLSSTTPCSSNDSSIASCSSCDSASRNTTSILANRLQCLPGFARTSSRSNPSTPRSQSPSDMRSPRRPRSVSPVAGRSLSAALSFESQVRAAPEAYESNLRHPPQVRLRRGKSTSSAAVAATELTQEYLPVEWGETEFDVLTQTVI